MIPLADAYALSFIAPLIVTALSVPVLGEHVGWKQWTAVIVGFVAVIVILRPSFDGLGLGQICALASAALFAGSMILVRRISKSETSAALTLVYFIMLFVISLPVTILHWKTPDLHAVTIMVIIGAASGLGNVLLIMAFRYAAATIVSSFMYSQLLWGTLFGLALFDDLPDLITLAGAIVIIGCGIYTLTQATTTRRVPA
jgi:drug/metabolite transporter (DMT)-like permease